MYIKQFNLKHIVFVYVKKHGIWFKSKNVFFFLLTLTLSSNLVKIIRTINIQQATLITFTFFVHRPPSLIYRLLEMNS